MPVRHAPIVGSPESKSERALAPKQIALRPRYNSIRGLTRYHPKEAPMKASPAMSADRSASIVQ
jgi:hypothetical protein